MEQIQSQVVVNARSVKVA